MTEEELQEIAALSAEVERLRAVVLQTHEILWNGRQPGRDRRAAYDEAQRILHAAYYQE